MGQETTRLPLPSPQAPCLDSRPSEESLIHEPSACSQGRGLALKLPQITFLQFKEGGEEALELPPLGLRLSALPWDKFPPPPRPTVILSFFICKMKRIIATSESKIEVGKPPQVNKLGGTLDWGSGLLFENENPETGGQ